MTTPDNDLTTPVITGHVVGRFVQVGTDGGSGITPASLEVHLTAADADTTSRIALAYAGTGINSVVLVRGSIVLTPDEDGNVTADIPTGQYTVRLFLQGRAANTNAIERFPITVLATHDEIAPLNLATQIPYHEPTPEAYLLTPEVIESVLNAVDEVQADATASADAAAEALASATTAAASRELAIAARQVAQGAMQNAQTAQAAAVAAKDAAAVTATGVTSAVQTATDKAAAAQTAAQDAATQAASAGTQAQSALTAAQNAAQAAQAAAASAQAAAGGTGDSQALQDAITTLTGLINQVGVSANNALNSAQQAQAAVDKLNALEAQRDWLSTVNFEDEYLIQSTSGGATVSTDDRIIITNATAAGLTIAMRQGGVIVAQCVITKPIYNSGSDYGLAGTYFCQSGGSFTFAQNTGSMTVTFRPDSSSYAYTTTITPHATSRWDDSLTWDMVLKPVSSTQPGGPYSDQRIVIWNSSASGLTVAFFSNWAGQRDGSRQDATLVLAKNINTIGDYNLAGNYTSNVGGQVTIAQNGDTITITIKVSDGGFFVTTAALKPVKKPVWDNSKTWNNTYGVNSFTSNGNVRPNPDHKIRISDSSATGGLNITYYIENMSYWASFPVPGVIGNVAKPYGIAGTYKNSAGNTATITITENDDGSLDLVMNPNGSSDLYGVKGLFTPHAV